MLERFGYRRIREELKGTDAHSLHNILTLDQGAHGLFDTLQLCFEEIPNQVCWSSVP